MLLFGEGIVQVEGIEGKQSNRKSELPYLRNTDLPHVERGGGFRAKEWYYLT